MRAVQRVRIANGGGPPAFAPVILLADLLGRRCIGKAEHRISPPPKMAFRRRVCSASTRSQVFDDERGLPNVTGGADDEQTPIRKVPIYGASHCPWRHPAPSEIGDELPKRDSVGDSSGLRRVKYRAYAEDGLAGSVRPYDWLPVG
jgi:hypothetical protein